jgi:2-hydroxychromene-2-carboxylate isomerase
MSADADLEFFFDPICPFAWITSRWVTEVAALKHYEVRWRFISLAVINEGKDYGAEFPPGYPALHGLGRDLLRVCAAAGAAHGNSGVAALYTAIGERLHPGGVSAAIWKGEPVPEGLVADVLVAAGLPESLTAAATDETWDAVLRDESATALGRAGRDVGTPILTFDPGTDRESSFFGPVISNIPRGDDAVRLWDAVRTLAATKGFAELKRSMRDDIVYT